MRGCNELNPIHGEQVEAYSQRDQEPTCLLPPDGAGMGTFTGVAIHGEKGRLGRGVLSAHTPQDGGLTYQVHDAAGCLGCLCPRRLHEPFNGPLSSLNTGAK